MDDFYNKNSVKNQSSEIDDYENAKKYLKSIVSTVSLFQNVDFHLYHYFSIKDSPQIYIQSKKDVRGVLDTKNLRYTLTDSEIAILNDDSEKSYKKIIEKEYDVLHRELRVFHIRFQGGEQDFDMVDLYIYCIYCLQFLLRNADVQHRIIRLPKQERNRFISINKTLVNELIQELLWRANRLNHLDRFNYNPDDEEMKLRVSAIFKKGINLIDKQRFEANCHEIYKRMVPKFMDKIPFEDFCNIFQTGGAIFLDEISWHAPLNSLYYFIKQLQDKEKTATKNNFRKAEELFVHDGRRIKNLTNNKSLTNEAQEIDKIIDLF